MRLLTITFYIIAAAFAVYVALFVLGLVLFGGFAFGAWTVALKFKSKADKKVRHRQESIRVESPSRGPVFK